MKLWHVVAPAVLLAIALTGCSSSSSPSIGASVGSSSDGIFQLDKTKCVDKNPPTVGHCIFITSSGFDPNVLVAPMGIDITWTNTSSKPASIVFDNYFKKVDSGPIPPGGTWKFHAGELVSIVYHSPDIPHSQSQLQIQQAEANSGANQ